MSDKDTISADEIRRFANALGALQQAFAALADWLKQHEIEEIPGVGTPTAKRGLNYLAGFSSAVLKAYTEDQLPDDLDDAERGKVSASLWGAGRMLKGAAKKRPSSKSRGGNHDRTPRSAAAKESATIIVDATKDDDLNAVEPKKPGRAKKR